MEQLEIRLLGTLNVRRPDGSFVGSGEWRTTKVKDLLRLLALEAGSPVKTEVLMERLWPGADPDRARASLRTATYQLRKGLDTDCLERIPGALTLTGAWTDAQAYTATADAVLARTPRRLGELATVIELVRDAESLYVGDLDVHDSSDDRLRETAEHLRARRVELLVEGAEAAGELLWTRESLAFASRAFQADDTSERAGRALMRAFAGLGETSKALEVYERLRCRLARQFGADPAPQTRALHLHLLDGGAGPDIEPGRIRIGLGPLTDLVASALLRVREASPSGGIVVLRTPPGSGWETALEHACDGLGLSHGRLGLEAAHVLGPAFASDDTGLDTNREHAEVVTLPAATSLAEPVQELLAVLVRRTRATVLVPVPHDLELPGGRLRWPGSGTVQVVTVERLTSPELQALARSILLGAPSPALLRALTIESAGLAGSAIEVLRRWLDAGRIVWTAAGLEVRPLDEKISTSVGSVRAYVTALSRTAIDVLSVLCVAGTRLTAEQVDAVAVARHPHQTVDVQVALDELVAAGLVSGGPAGFALTPCAAADELVAWLTPEARRRLHYVVAEAIALDPVARIAHWVEAGHHQRACDAGIAALATAAPDSVEAERIVDSLGRLPASLHVGGHAMDLGEWLTCWQAKHRPELVLDGGARHGFRPIQDVDSEMRGRRSALRRARFRVHMAFISVSASAPEVLLTAAAV